ncbi:hypothetical protein CRYUN_Cryun36dG0101300 [Craigia yunnanensis]
MLGNNLPSAWEVIELYKSQNIRRMRLYDPNQAALPGCNKMYKVTGQVSGSVRSAGLQDQIKVSIAIDMTLIGNSFPPSAGAFRGDVTDKI